MASRRSREELEEVVMREFEMAREARLEGNEGRARVCARRAAGWALESIYDPAQAEELPEANAYRFLSWFKEQGHFPGRLRAAADRLTARVAEDFTLPFEQDPLDDAEMIINWVLEEHRDG
ncbi:MAG: hypothetical protein P1P76_09620 [Anaerolineales bacterium]|nr:hypothetical protein [Anaerolineales bacterium]